MDSLNGNRILEAFGTSIFSEMTKAANDGNAVNLSQGFPDFEGPRSLIEDAFEAMLEGNNQYARPWGHPNLVEAVANKVLRETRIDLDPYSQVHVFTGATGALASCVIGLLNPGDEVILFEPFYDSYPALAKMTGAIPKYYTLPFPDFEIDPDKLRALFNSNTKMIILNTPHNPSGKVFSQAELEMIADLAKEFDAIVIADEVYEYLTFDGFEHISIATLPDMFERTLTISSTGKTFSMTGWKIGWATGPYELLLAANRAHQNFIFCVAAPLQIAMAKAINSLIPSAYLDNFRADYDTSRGIVFNGLANAGFNVAEPRGTYFMLADASPFTKGNGRDMAYRLIEEAKVASIPASAFYSADTSEKKPLLRFGFCKKEETLIDAMEKLKIWSENL